MASSTLLDRERRPFPPRSLLRAREPAGRALSPLRNHIGQRGIFGPRTRHHAHGGHGAAVTPPVAITCAGGLGSRRLSRLPTYACHHRPNRDCNRYRAAVLDNYEPGDVIGYGATKDAAIQDLLEQIEEGR